MRRWLLLILGILLLYVVPSLILQLIYGPSYGFLSGEDCWQPDGHGGWEMHGFPDDPRPDQASVVVPLFLRLAPFALPALLLILFLTGPLSQFIDRQPDYDVNRVEFEEYRTDYSASKKNSESPGENPDQF